jgi:hypothetical protein
VAAENPEFTTKFTDALPCIVTAGDAMNAALGSAIGPVTPAYPENPEKSTAANRTLCGLSPAFVLLSFEGPDPYSRAGGLGSRVSGLAEEGYETHLFYIDAPDLPGHKLGCSRRLHLHRWCQWISRYHPGGVYDGEEGKL